MTAGPGTASPTSPPQRRPISPTLKSLIAPSMSTWFVIANGPCRTTGSFSGWPMNKATWLGSVACIESSPPARVRATLWAEVFRMRSTASSITCNETKLRHKGIVQRPVGQTDWKAHRNIAKRRQRSLQVLNDLPLENIRRLWVLPSYVQSARNVGVDDRQRSDRRSCIES